ncbi:MAG TPA: hypothetical protein VF406_16260 [Thermodesulfobacteriota bacterium]
MPARTTALALAALLILPAACATPRNTTDAEDDTRTADFPAPMPRPAPVTVTPVRFDAYLLALRNIREVYPAFVAAGNQQVVGDEMREPVARAGLTLEEFRTLHAQVQADPMLKAEADRRLAGAPARGSASGARETPPPATAPSPAP